MTKTIQMITVTTTVSDPDYPLGGAEARARAELAKQIGEKIRNYPLPFFRAQILRNYPQF